MTYYTEINHQFNLLKEVEEHITVKLRYVLTSEQLNKVQLNNNLQEPEDIGESIIDKVSIIVEKLVQLHKKQLTLQKKYSSLNQSYRTLNENYTLVQDDLLLNEGHAEEAIAKYKKNLKYLKQKDRRLRTSNEV